MFQSLNKRLKRIGWLAWFVRVPVWFFLFEVNSAASIALHESGHALRDKAFGFDYELGGVGRKLEKNIFAYYAKKMAFQGGFDGFCKRIILERNKNKKISVIDYYDQNIIISAGGLNNQMLLSENIGYDMYVRKQYNSLLWAIYLYLKIYPVDYERRAKDDNLSFDPTAIITAFNEKGRKDFKRGTIGTASLISTFLSATTYSIFTGKPICIAGFRVPNVYTYITTRGMSYKVVSGYEFGKDKYINFGCESVFGKESALEVFVGIDRIDKLSLPVHLPEMPIHYKCTATFGLSLGIEGSITVPLSSWLSVGIGCEYYHFSSLQGQRSITRNVVNVDKTSVSINKKSTSANIFCFVSYRY
ncbi:MAG: hypothetical protein LBD17_00770 [Endomicrobium sp.]|nr:hypothetical protein [Endomicrobium sp.]